MEENSFCADGGRRVHGDTSQAPPSDEESEAERDRVSCSLYRCVTQHWLSLVTTIAGGPVTPLPTVTPPLCPCLTPAQTRAVSSTEPSLPAPGLLLPPLRAPVPSVPFGLRAPARR